MIIGILALQGDFSKHREVLVKLAVKTVEVRNLNDLEKCDGLIIPGGESTVLSRLMEFSKLDKSIVEFSKNKPIFGTCAGLIMMSSKVQDDSVKTLGILDVTVERNAFGRQVESFQAPIELALEQKHAKEFPGFFIRAPKIRNISKNIEVLAKFREEPILIKEGFHLGATFHPELSSDPSIHLYFIELIKQAKRRN